MGSITVGELQAAALPAEARLLSGAAGLGREATWPATLRTRPPAFQSLRGGEFLLISAEAMRLLDPELTLARLLHSVARVEVAAAAVAGEVPDDAVRLAESLGLPLFALPPGAAVADVEQALSRAIADWQAELQRQSQELYRHLTELAIEGRGLAAIAAAVARATGRAVAFEDRTFAPTLHALQNVRALRGGPPGDHAAAIARALREGQAPVVGWLRSHRVSASEPPCAEFPLSGPAVGRLVAPVVLREGVVGYVSLLHGGQPFRELDRQAVVRAAAAFAIELLREAAAVEAEERVGATFLDDLLAGASVSPEAVRRLASRLGHDLSAPQVVLVFQQHGQPAATPAGRPAPASTPALQAALEPELGRRRVRALCRAWEDRAVLLYPAPEGEALRGEVQSLAAAVAARLGAPVSLGASRPCVGAEHVQAAYRQAQGALDLGVRLFGPGRATFYADLGLYRLLLAMNGSPELPAFYEETLGKLREHDRRSDGELIRTLEAYFAGRNSPTEAAERLHVHRNTLLYRLRRIQAITGLDLDDPETRLALHLALHVGHVLGK